MSNILIDSEDVRLLKAVQEYMNRTGNEILTPEIIDKIIQALREKYIEKTIH